MPQQPVAPNTTGAPNTGSSLFLNSGVNKTSVALSTNIIILVNNTAVGAVQSLSINENRTITKISELGTDGIINSAPTASTDITGSCQRIRFDRLRITEAFSRGFLHAASQVYPFDVVILDKAKRNAASQISTIIKAMWITQLSYAYNHDNWIITDTMNWTAESIFSVLNNGNQPAAVGGERNIPHLGSNGVANIISGDNIVNIENLVDTNAAGRRGSMDASGLIDIGSDTQLF